MEICKISTEKTESDDSSANTIFELQQLPELKFLDHLVNQSSRLNIDLADSMPIILPPLIWSDSNQKPLKIIAHNTGYTLNIEAEYSRKRPMLNGSILLCPYEFWCFHFHWRVKEDDNSEHSILGKRFPMEIHLVFYNIGYSTTDIALNNEDGILILVYMCKLEDNENSVLTNLISNLEKITQPGKSTNIDPFELSSLFDCKLRDYFIYWRADEHDHKNPTLWIISPKTVSIGESQLSRMRSLMGADNKRIVSNCRASGSIRRTRVYGVSQRPCETENVGVAAELRTPSVPDVSPSAAGRGTPAASVSAADGVTGEQRPPTTTAGNDVGSEKWTTRPPSHYGATRPLDLEGAFGSDDRSTVFGRPRGGTNGAKTRDEAKDNVIRSIDSLLNELNSDINMKNQPCKRKKVKETHREGVRMNTTALRREQHIKNRLQKKF